MHPAVSLSSDLFWMWYPELVLVPDLSCSHSRDEDVSLGSGTPWELLRSPSRREPQQGQAPAQKGITFVVFTKTACALPGGDRLVPLYRKQLEKSEVMVRKISPSPYLRRYSSPQLSKASNHN